MMSTQSPQRLIPNFFSMSVFNVLSMIISLASTILITRRFSVEDFGVYTLVLVLVNFFSQISTFGLELSIPKFIASAQDEQGQTRFFGTAVIIRVGSIILTSLLAWYGAPLIKILFGQSLLPDFFFYVPLLFMLESLRALFRATLQGRFLFIKIGIGDAFASLSFLILVVSIFYAGGDITLLIVARIFSSALIGVFYFASIPFTKRLSFRIDTLKEFIRFGYPLQINNIMSFIYSRVDTIAVAMFLGPSEIAAYEVARKIPDYLRTFYEPFRSIYYPHISKRYALDNPLHAVKLVNDANRFVSFVTLLGAAIAILFNREIIQFVFTDKYLSSGPVFAILMINLSLGLMGNVMGTTLVSIGDTKKPAIINFFNTAVSLIGSILLIPVYRLIGAGIANTTGTAISLPLNYYFLNKKLDLNKIVYYKTLLVFSLWGLIVFILRPELFLLKAVFLVLFVFACAFFSIITKQDLIIVINGLRLDTWSPIKKFLIWISSL